MSINDPIKSIRSSVQEDIDESIRAYTLEELSRRRKEAVSESVKKIKKSIEEAELAEKIERASRKVDAQRKAKIAKRLQEQEWQEREEQLRAVTIQKIRTRKMEAYSKQCSVQNHSVRYEAQNNCYYFDGSMVFKNPPRIKKTMKEHYIKSNISNSQIFDYIFDGLDKKRKKALRECDPHIVLLLAKKSPAMAKKYVYKVVGETTYSIDCDNYNIVYDIRGIDEIPSDELLPKDKLYTKRLIKNTGSAAHVIKDKKKAPWYAIIPMIGTIALSGLAGYFCHQSMEKTVSENSYTDITNPDERHSTITEATTIQTEVATEEPDTIFEPTESYTEPTIEHDQIIDDDIDKPEDNKKDNTTVSIKVGDKVHVSDGTQYTSNCLGGGNCYAIGAVSWRPATEYYIDSVAFIYDGKVLGVKHAKDTDVKQTIMELASENNVDESKINTSVLLSLTPGSGDTGWTEMSIESIEKNINKQTENQSYYTQNKVKSESFENER
ncbi:MAG: hypothetical protein IKE01_01225 [Clostridia bacterium]|nr:hypothetical protein [Clostridia bacterium]